MKNRLIIPFIFCALLFAMSCENDRIIFEPSTNFVQIGTDNTVVVTEDSGTAVATMFELGSPAALDVVVNFTVSSDDNARFETSVPLTGGAGSVTIPAGDTSAGFTLTPVDNFDVDGGIDITVDIVSSQGVPFGIAGEEFARVSRVISIADNDCPITITDWVGTYSVSENFTAGVNSPNGLSDFFGEAYQIELSLDPNDISGTKVIINNSPGFNEYIADGTVMSFLTCTGEIVFDAGFPTVALFRVFEFDATSYDEAAFEIQATGPLATFGDYQFTFTRQ